MISLDLLESNKDAVLHSLETHNFTFFSSIGAIPALQFFSKITQAKFLFISDDLGISQWYKDIPYQTSVYDDRFSVEGSSWLTYELVLFLLSQDTTFLNSFDFIIMDGIDQRSANSDFVFSLIVNLKLQNKFIVLQRSNYQYDLYTKFLEKYGYTSNLINLEEQSSISTYFLPEPCQNINKEILETLDTILSTDTISNSFDILILLSNDYEIHQFKTLILDSSINHDFSIITDLFKYQVQGSHRRIILSTNSHYFQDFPHKIRYIIDSGLQGGIPINKNQIEQHLSILRNEDSSYFGMFSESGVIDSFNHLSQVELLPFIIYLLKFNQNLNDFEFLSSPPLNNIKKSISYGIYMGILKINDVQDLKLSEMGVMIIKYQLQLNISSISLYTSLVVSITKNFPQVVTCSIMKIISMLITQNIGKLTKFIHKDFEFKKSLSKIMSHDESLAESDFISLVFIFNEIIGNEQHIKTSGAKHNVIMNKFNKDEKKQILHVYKQLEKIIGYNIKSKEPLDPNQLHKCLFIGFQLQCATIIKNVSNGNDILDIELIPVIRPLLLTEKHTTLNNSPEGIDLIKSNDIIIYYKSEYITF
ncbi:putative pre-mRNA-splicing factor ATP-dependent RNA helicase [Wickerhamomyces ciferrii]|uniref:Pre-mRNA-splicing factor ATP-dependent RNA helicase n=1 Tax=Wickerhamomyces ciferrii (strain ATCC 14091 / BCRC 22168 / CBS 111 / JCM 3599 / NBRC 0793 / NRRL Y-1031 F-60-10) TaxID=1206466 RepID=K0KMY5_WICCF|nr:putative pre-mRNA-splicing factor ATP-dependent RNA helicase [Wickerhamomyces ciferrii]CCH42488.1 putative pre-mRNA-splicing factor ATP-dependent RNA helicase [Wickerhamomyces ciferrii]